MGKPSDGDGTNNLTVTDLSKALVFLAQQLSGLLANPLHRYFDPQRVSYLFDRYETIRPLLSQRFPMLSTLRACPAPKSSGTSDNEGRGYIQRDPLELLRDAVAEAIAFLPDATDASPTLQVGLPAGDPRRVFVVHGRNHRARQAIVDLLRALHLQPLEWTELREATGSGSPYVYEILEEGFMRARAVIILLTDDEEVRLQTELRGDPGDDSARRQPRPNVLFEAGMAFQRDRKRAILVEFGGALRGSDLDGIHSVRVNHGTDWISTRKEIAQRLRSAGCEVNTSGDDWLKAGDFEAALKGS